MQDQNWLSSIRPLPSRVIPFPEEDLASLLCRSAHAMGYKNVRWLLSPEEVSPGICYLHGAVNYRLLERLLLVSEENLYRMTIHRFAVQLQGTGEIHSIGGKEEIQRSLLTRYTVRRFILSQTRTRICPLCLAEGESYGRLCWNVLPVVVCPRHHILLADQCPVCQKTIPLLRSSLTCCPRCQKGDYRQVPIMPLVDEPLLHASQALILDHLGIEEYKMLGMTGISESPLTHLIPWQYFLLFDAFRCVLSPLSLHHPFLQASSHLRTVLNAQLNGNTERSFHELLVFIVTFHYIFESWPDNFFALLNSFPLAREHLSGGGIVGRFGSIYRTWLCDRLTHASFTFLREAFADYLKNHYTGGVISKLDRPFRGMELLQDRRYLTMKQTAEILEISNDSVSGVHKLIRSGELHPIKVLLGKQGKKHIFLIEKVEVEALLKRWCELIPFKTVQESFLGINREHMEDLAHAGLLLPCSSRGTGWYYERKDVDLFISVVMQNAQKAQGPLDTVPLSRFVPFTTWTLKDTFLAIFNGSLKLTDVETQQPLFQRLVLTRAEANRFIEDMAQQRHQNLGFTVYEVASGLGVSFRLVLSWISEGFIEAETIMISKMRSSLRISQEAVEAFRKSYVFSEEAVELLNITPWKLSEYAQRGMLHSLRGKKQRLLFHREEVEALELTLASGGIGRGMASSTSLRSKRQPLTDAEASLAATAMQE